MIPLNSRCGLPPNAFWYLALRSLATAIFLMLIGGIVQMAAAAPNASCHGLLCGKISGGQLAGLIYLFAALLVVRAVLYFKLFSFVVTDKNISINSGVLFQNSCTIRFDRIQDIDTIRGPLHLMLGLKSLAIWTASPDQRVGNSNRPDGLIVLDADLADWLKEYLSDPPTASGGDSSASNNRLLAGPSNAKRPGNTGFALTVAVVALVVGFLVWFSKRAIVTAPTTASTPAAVTALAVATERSSGMHPMHRHPLRMDPVQSDAGVPARYAVACAIHQSGGVDSVTPCANLGQARRCEHETDFPSQPTPEPAELTIVNRSEEGVKFYWLDRSGARALYAALPPGGHVSQQSHTGAHWLVSTQNDECIAIFDAATLTVGIF